jgi:hypothetical protein
MNNRNESNPVIHVFGDFPAESPCQRGFSSGKSGVWHESLLAKMAQNENKAISY